MLDGAVITGDEVPTQTYGPSTADAVLEYKSARDIINRTYQTTADNIVGIMTINRMDTEIAALEALMPEMIRRTRLAAFQRTFAAFMRVVGIGPPPPPNRPDPNAENRRQARLVAIDIFNNPNPDAPTNTILSPQTQPESPPANANAKTKRRQPPSAPTPAQQAATNAAAPPLPPPQPPPPPRPQRPSQKTTAS